MSKIYLVCGCAESDDYYCANEEWIVCWYDNRADAVAHAAAAQECAESLQAERWTPGSRYCKVADVSPNPHDTNCVWSAYGTEYDVCSIEEGGRNRP